MRSSHAQPSRGLIKQKAVIEPSKWNKETGCFGQIFPPSTEQWGDVALEGLAKAMVAKFDDPKDGLDEEESGIPALYTYFGQFIDHDLVFDPSTSLQRRKDVNALVDFRTPAFDLDSVYGRGPGDQPYMYDEKGTSFLLGDPLTLGHEDARDLLRSSAGRAVIGDPRNDENAIVSQLQGLFHRFHNRLVREGRSFEDSQRTLVRHYQHVVLHDFLPRIVHKDVLSALKGGDGYYDKNKLIFLSLEFPFMPVEFSGACYRFGHSMVRPGYRLNGAILLPIFPSFPTDGPPFPQGLTGMQRMISNWGIDWARFIDIEDRKYDGIAIEKSRRLQFAYRIDTSLVDPLGSLPAALALDPSSLALRNLKRGRQLSLPSGQAVATAMMRKGVPHASVLDDEQIIIGRFADVKGGGPVARIDASFRGNCPLWTYVLAEAMHHTVDVQPRVAENREEPGRVTIKTPQLGPVGGRIVAEVIVGLMLADPLSVLNDGSQPAVRSGFALRDFVAFALDLPGSKLEG